MSLSHFKFKKLFVGPIIVVVAIGLFLTPSYIHSQTPPLSNNREELMALIQVLLARVAELQAQIASQSGQGGQTGYVFSKNLTVGSIGPDVQALQRFLTQKGFMLLPTGTAFGKFGPKTKAALTAYQRSKAITPLSGFFGPKTRAIVNAESAALAIGPGTPTTPTYGTGGSGNAPTTPRRSGGGGGGGGGSSSSSSNNNPDDGGGDDDGDDEPSSGQCSDGSDNDNDGLTDFPIDPGCSSASSDESSNPAIDVTYAYKHMPNASAGACTGSGTSFVCNPTSNFHNVIYPWVLDVRNGSLNPYMAKAYMDQLPEGGRGMFSWVMDAANNSQGNFYRDADNCVDGSGNTLTFTYNGAYPVIVDNAGNSVTSGGQVPYRCPWMDDWFSVVQPRWDTFFRDYAAIGGKVDVVTIDNEVMSSVASLDWVKIPSILSNPKFTQTNTNFPVGNLARGSMQSKMGNLATLLTNQTNCEAVGCLTYATMLLYDWFNSYMNRATYDAARAYFPNIAVTNFGTSAYDFEEYKLPIFNYTTSCLAGSYCSSGVVIGNYQQPGYMYGPNVAHPGTAFDNVHPYQNTYFSKLREETIYTKISRLSAPETGMAPLYASAYYTATRPDGFYAEGIFHSLAAGSDFLNNWHDGAPTIPDERALSEAMDEFDAIAGFEDKNTLMFEDDWLNERLTRANPSAWNDDFLLTGIESGGRNVWRFTPEAGHVAEIPNVASTLVSTNPVTFQTAQYRIEFPEGKIYTPPNTASNLGYWIVQPEGEYPVITNDSDINVPPVAVFSVATTNEVAAYVVFDSQNSLDPDGPFITREYDFDGNGTYGDLVVLGDWHSVPVDQVQNPGWFFYRYVSPGIKTVGLKVTDSEGASTIYRRTFTLPSTPCDFSVFSGQCGINTFAASAHSVSDSLVYITELITRSIGTFWQNAAAGLYGFFSAAGFNK